MDLSSNNLLRNKVNNQFIKHTHHEDHRVEHYVLEVSC